jgi:hypothetical protein
VCSGVGEAVQLTLKGAKILDWRTSGAALSLRSVCTFWRLVTGPAGAALCDWGPAMVSRSACCGVVVEWRADCCCCWTVRRKGAAKKV